MLSIEEALSRVVAGVEPLETERLPLERARGRALAEDVFAPEALPPWDASAMDGYAVRASEVPGILRLLGEVRAGQAPDVEVAGGTALRIMTGAPVPAGADAVVMVEDTRESTRDGAVFVEVSVPSRPGRHVRARGSEVALGKKILPAGTVLRPGSLALIASVGIAEVAVRRAPRVAFFTTGDEVVPPGTPLLPGQIHGSNGLALRSLIEEAGGIALDLGNVPDDPGRLAEAFRAAAGADVVLSTGGVSVGAHDHVKDVLLALGGTLGFWKVAMKPGKPLAYGRVNGAPFFGLPGNPVSCMVNFLLFVRPVLRRMLGDARPFLPVRTARWGAPFARTPGRVELVRVRLEHDEGGGRIAFSAGEQGSAHLEGMAAAEGVAVVPADVTTAEGLVRVILFEGRGSAEPPRLS